MARGNGSISGTPTSAAAGSTSVVFTVTDSSAPMQTATATLSMAIDAAAPPATLAITTASLPSGTVGSSYSAQIGITGGTAPYSYSAVTLPGGLAINAATGAITGSPSSAGTTQVVFTVTDASVPMQTAAATLTVRIVSGSSPSPLAISTTSLPGGTVGSSYSAQIAVTGGTAPYAYSAVTLPGGLAIDAATGAITGSPSSAGSTQVAFTVTDASAPMQTAVATLTIAIVSSTPVPPTSGACSGISLGANANLNGFLPFPASNAWNTDISAAPLDANNTAITTAAGFAGLHLHHDFSSVAGGNYGIPYNVVDSSITPMVTVNVTDYPSESDVAVAPFAAAEAIEGAPANCYGWPNAYNGDQHLLVIDRATCMLYETWNTHACNGQWNASQETIWDLQANEQRPWGWTSADAAGLSLLAGLIRYDEVVAGSINHAIRFTMQHTKNDANNGYFVPPATHAAGTTWGVSNVMGMRIRLKSSFDISSYSATNKIILTAMKKYGMILADNGGYFFFQAAPDARWNDADLGLLDQIQSSNFEVVQMTPSFPGWDSATAPTGAAPTIASFTASPTSVASGAAVTLNWSTSNDSYDFIDKLGGIHGNSITIHPAATATYTLNATNQYGRSTAQVTVTVH